MRTRFILFSILGTIVLNGCGSGDHDREQKNVVIEIIGKKVDLEKKIATYTVYTNSNMYSDTELLLHYSDSLKQGMDYVAIGYFDLKEETPQVSDKYTIPLDKQEHLFAIFRPEYPENINYKLVYTDYGKQINEKVK